MAFKFILSFCAVLATVNAGAIYAPAATYATAPLITKLAQPSIDAVASTQHNVVRSFGGTVSTYSKNVVTPYSSVSKTDSRITNNVYTPAVAKTLYAAPAVTKTIVAPVPTVAAYTAHAPVFAKTVYSAPVAKTVYSTPVVAKPLAYAAPTVYSHAAPTVYSHAAPTVYSHAAPTVYSHAAPASAVVAAPHAISYSPAAAVAHVSFDGFGSHWGY